MEFQNWDPNGAGEPFTTTILQQFIDENDDYDDDDKMYSYSE